MNIKIKIIIYGLIGYTSFALAYGSEEEIYDSHQNTKIFNNIAIKVKTTGSKKIAEKYQIIISIVSTTINNHPKNFSEILRPVVQTIDKTLWTITSDQLPLTKEDCMKLDLDFQNKDSAYGYKYCLLNTDPEIIAFDDKNKKLYLSYGTTEIGTGGGPSLLFAADVNQRKIKFLNMVWDSDHGSLSPSGQYLVIYGSSRISVGDMETNKWINVNTPERIHSDGKKIVHRLSLKSWISDTRFTYIDAARYRETKSLINTKEITYDIAARTNIDKKIITSL